MSCSCYLATTGCYHIPPPYEVKLEDLPTPSLGTKIVVHLLIFGTAVASNVAWNSFSFAMMAFQRVYDDADLALAPYFWSIVLLLYNTPGLPVMLLLRHRPRNAILRLGYWKVVVTRTAMVTLPLCFLVGAVLPIALWPTVPPIVSFLVVAVAVFLIGGLQAAYFGWLVELCVSFPSAVGYRTSETVLSGMGLATFVLLAITLSLGYNAQAATVNESSSYFALCALVILVGFGCTCVLVWVPDVTVLFRVEEKVVEREETRRYLIQPPAGTDAGVGYTLLSQQEMPGGGAAERRMACCADDTGSSSAVDKGGCHADLRDGANVREGVATFQDKAVTLQDEAHLEETGPTSEICSCPEGVCRCEESALAHALGQTWGTVRLLREMLPSLVCTALSALTLIAVSGIIPFMTETSSYFVPLLMYSQAMAVFAGNLVSLVENKLSSMPRVVIAAAALRVPPFVFLVVYAGAEWTWSTWFIIIVIVLHGSAGSYLNSVSYQMLRKTLPGAQLQAGTQSLNVALYLSYDIGALIPLMFPAIFKQ